MTLLTKPVTRETAAQERTRPIVVTLHPRYLSVGPKGTRERYNLDYELLLAMGGGLFRLNPQCVIDEEGKPRYVFAFGPAVTV